MINLTVMATKELKKSVLYAANLPKVYLYKKALWYTSFWRIKFSPKLYKKKKKKKINFSRPNTTNNLILTPK